MFLGMQSGWDVTSFRWLCDVEGFQRSGIQEKHITAIDLKGTDFFIMKPILYYYESNVIP